MKSKEKLEKENKREETKMIEIKNNNINEVKVKKFDLDKANKIASFAFWFLLWLLLALSSLFIGLDGIKIEKIMVIGATMLVGVIATRIIVAAEQISKGKVIIEYFLYLIGIAGVVASLYISLSMGMWFFIVFVFYIVINSVHKLKTLGVYSIMLFLASIYLLFTHLSILTMVMFLFSLKIVPYTILGCLAEVKDNGIQIFGILANQVLFLLFIMGIEFYLNINQKFIVLLVLGLMILIVRFFIEKDHLTEEEKEEIRKIEMEIQNENPESDASKIVNIVLTVLIYCLILIPILISAIKFYF